ncbi:MAG: cell division protein FtsL [Candidatus Cloacimonetes bacterium]|nr:cell division protein FtsL [Candidatus Cloacimonadota bacterium]
MNYKVVIFVFIIFTTIFLHYYNKHHILNISKENTKLTELLKSRKDINLGIVMENIELSSRYRIEKLATEKLNMFYPEDTSSRHIIVMNKDERSFSLIDYIIPSVEAFTKK